MENLKKCPECGREIKAEAIKCRFCRTCLVKDLFIPQTSSNAIASLVLGCLGFFCWGIPGIVAIILGLDSLREIRRSKGRVSGGSMAIAGIILGSIFLALHILYFMLFGSLMMLGFILSIFK